MKTLLQYITSTRMVYFLMSMVLIFGYIFRLWEIVIFVCLMLQIGVWTGFCPSKYFFEKCGFKKTEL